MDTTEKQPKKPSSPFAGSPRQNLAMAIAAQAHELQTVALEIRKHANREVVSGDPVSRAATTSNVYAGLLRVVQLALAISMKLGRLEGVKNNV